MINITMELEKIFNLQMQKHIIKNQFQFQKINFLNLDYLQSNYLEMIVKEIRMKQEKN